MRRARNSLTSFAVVACFLMGLFGMLCSPVRSNAPDEKDKKLAELTRKRLAVLEKLHELVRKGVQAGLISHEQLRAAKSELLSARLDYADTKQERLKICDEAVKDATEWQRIVQEGAKAHVFSGFDELRAEADLLEAQIARENADHDDD